MAPYPQADREVLEAAKEGDVVKVAAALSTGVNVEATDDFARTPLLWAVTNNHVEAARLLLEAGASPDAVDRQQDTPWLVTGVTGSVPMAQLLLEYHPDLTLKNRYGGIAIIPASERGHVEYVRAMAHSGMDLNHVNDLGWTALLEAVYYGDGSKPYQEIVQILLDAGADPGIKDSQGLVALDHARSKGQTEIVQILQSHS